MGWAAHLEASLAERHRVDIMISVSPVVLMLALIAQPGADEPAFQSRVREARAALGRSDLERARGLCREAFAESGDVEGTGTRAAEAKAVCADVELKAKRPADAVKELQEATHLARDARLRAKLLDARLRAAQQAKLAAEVARVKALREHDAALEKALKRRAFDEAARLEARASLERAEVTYRQDGDAGRADRAVAALALVLVRGGKPEEGVPRAKSIAHDKGRAREARIVALEALMAHGEASGDLELAIGSALELNDLTAEGLRDAERRYARLAGLDGLCARYDEAHGRGACARLERRTTGHFSFTDYSKAAPRRMLSQEDMSRVHAQLLPALEDCILTAARRAPDVFTNTDVEVAWVVQPRGEASNLEIAPRRIRPDVEGCLGERLGWARYPPYSAEERTTVRIPFHLSN